MALTRSKPASIFTPEGNSLAVFIDVADGTLKLKDVFGDVELFSNFISGGGGGLNLLNDVVISAILTQVVDKDNTPSALRISTTDITNYGGGAVTTNTAFGDDALIANTTGSDNTAVGFQALVSNNTGNLNTAFGKHAMFTNTTGYNNTANGKDALYFNTTGFQNSAFGLRSLYSNTTGGDNTAIGQEALRTNIIGNSNTAIGQSSLYNNIASSNVAVGFESAYSNTSGTGITAIGYQALRLSTGINNTAIGQNTLPAITTGTNNTAIGFNTGLGLTTGSNNTILGAQVTGLSPTLANNVILADGSGNQRVIVDSSGNVGLNNGTSTTQATSVIRSLGTNSGIALVPNGTGAITADIPDGTVAGGNARGANAIDLQSSRGNANQVAAADYSVALGVNNRTVSPYSVAIGEGNTTTGFFGIAIGNGSSTGDTGAIAMGTSNTSTAEYGVVSGGQSHIGNGRWAVIGGGISNNQNSTYGTISGGQSNTASTNTHATVVGGFTNVSSGQFSISGGNTNTASGTSSIALGDTSNATANLSIAMMDSNASGTRSFAAGFSITASGQESVALGGQGGSASGRGSFKMPGFGNTAIADYSVSQGFADSYLYGQCAFSSNSLNGNQTLYSNLLMSKRDTLSSNTSTVLSLDGTGVTNLLIPGGQRWAWNVQIKTIAVVASVIGTATGITEGDSWLENETILFKRVLGVSSIVNSASDNLMFDASMSSCAMAYTIGTSNELKLTFTAPTFIGGGSVILHVASKIELTELKYG